MSRLVHAPQHHTRFDNSDTRSVGKPSWANAFSDHRCCAETISIPAVIPDGDAHGVFAKTLDKVLNLFFFSVSAAFYEHVDSNITLQRFCLFPCWWCDMIPGDIASIRNFLPSKWMFRMVPRRLCACIHMTMI